jgi:putative lipoic acid-binding regulatory protein
MSDKEKKVPLVEFPCEFVIKVMGKSTESFEETMTEIVATVFPLPLPKCAKRPSKDGNYIALSFTVLAKSQEPLDAVYETLSKHPEVLMAL